MKSSASNARDSRDFLVEILGRSGLSDDQVCDRMGVDPVTFAAWLSGRQEMSTRERLLARKVLREAADEALAGMTAKSLFADMATRLARGVVPASNMTTAARGVLPAEWETLSCVLLARAILAEGEAHPAWMAVSALPVRWEPLTEGRRRAWDQGLLDLNIAVDLNDLEIL